MIIDLMVWAPTREQFIAGVVENGFATFVDGVLAPTEDVLIDEIGSILKSPGTYDTDGNELTPAVIQAGWHANLRAYGTFAEQVTYGLPQEGDVFNRTYVLWLIPDLEQVPATETGVPDGWQGQNQVRLFDPGAPRIPARVWA